MNVSSSNVEVCMFWKVNSMVTFVLSTCVGSPGGPLEWQEGVSGSSMDTQKAS